MILDDVKARLRISHTKLDNDINGTIKTAKAEMIRLGILPSKAENDEDPLIAEAIKTFCQKQYTDDEKKQEMFTLSWEVQVDGLRKHRGYNKEEDQVEEDVQ